MGRRIPPRAAPVPILLLATALAWLPTAGSAVAGVACGGFHQVPTPNPGTLADTLESVSAASPHAAWAVGNWANQSKEGGLILRFNGTSWSAQHPPAAAGPVELQAVDARTPTDVWAVGQRFVGSPGGGGSEETITLHWNGSAWSRVPSPNVGTVGSSLHAVVAIAHDDVWAMGSSNIDLDRFRTLVEHWDGTSWSVVPSPNPGTSQNFLNAASGSSASDIWAVGQRAPDTSGFHGRTLAEHWNGSAWSVVRTPNVGAANHLFGVVAIGPNSAWAVGTGSGGGRTLAERWNGHTWRIVETPNVGTNPNELDAVDAASPTNVWAIGDVLTGGLGIQSQAVRWNGVAWHEMPVEQAGSSETALGDVAAIPGTTRLWAAGESATGDSSRQKSLVEQGC